MKNSLSFTGANTEALETSSTVTRSQNRSAKYKHIVVTHYGGPDELRVVEEDCPEPKKGEVRVRVQAAGVSLPDVMMREGIHPETPRVPFTPGWDVVGVVDRLGAAPTLQLSNQLKEKFRKLYELKEFIAVKELKSKDHYKRFLKAV